MIRRFATALLCIGMSASGQDAQEPELAAGSTPFVAVKSMQARGISEDEAATLSDVLRGKLMESGRFRVMERGQMEEILREQAFQQSGACTEEACLVEMGQLLGIEQLIAGSIGKVGSAYAINARVISVKTGEILHTVAHHYTGPIESLLTSEMNVVARKLAGLPITSPNRVDKRKTGRMLLIGGGAVALAAGGAAAIVLLKSDDPAHDESAEVIVQWQ
jgi:TolB-like protein